MRQVLWDLAKCLFFRSLVEKGGEEGSWGWLERFDGRMDDWDGFIVSKFVVKVL
jgi:hypothetical protein